MNNRGVVSCNTARQHVDEDKHGQHISTLERADKPHDTEGEEQEADRPELNACTHTNLREHLGHSVYCLGSASDDYRVSLREYMKKIINRLLSFVKSLANQ